MRWAADGFALAAHAGDGGGEGGFGQAEALDTDLADFDAVEAAQRGGELGLQAGFESRQLHLRRIGVHQIGEVDAAGGDLERGPGETAELAGGFVGIVAHGADELFDVGRVVRNLPGDEGLHEDAQAIPGADILQAGGGGAQAQIHRDGGFNRGGNFPGEAGLADDAHGAPNSVTTTAVPALTMMAEAASTAPARISVATPKRSARRAGEAGAAAP